ncbi:branched-chain amino acid aminotransferase [Phenylobacterium sp.]|uniref:branched-chain amino acid aminotransferase n=1 Tax=Phenylobacterium sp. TaxID=1871053 RepID=UPI001212241C|nr:branched-chain amino acid aminotransferase [Phenylobacterium sp.]THD67293.1 MAG: branched-chain amino acid aminotransferase [Phenylobacterium sp.]
MIADSLPTFLVHPSPTPVPETERAQLLADPGFGRVFTDHMVTIRYSESRGWHDPEVRQRGPIALDPAAAVLHYAQEIFEGLKAYRGADGGVLMFQPAANARRFQLSAARLAMPILPEALFVEALEQLVRIDAAWIPDGDGSLYLRPFMFATEVFLGVKPSSEYLFVVIASPVGSYFKGKAKPLSVWVSDEYARAAPGGTGAAKCGGNYAASLLPQAEAIRHECDQVVFLDAKERRWVEELGGMNIFFVFEDGSVRTPPLGGTILPGITRSAIITLARARGLEVREEAYSIEQWREDAASKRLREVFACGTAAVVAAIGQVRSREGDFIVGDGQEGQLTGSLRAELADIQRGRSGDPHGWRHPVT